MNPQERIAYLNKELSKHNQAYYVEAAPTITDSEYDQLFRELETLEQHYPQYASENSPTKRVGGAILTEFPSHPHEIPMLSIDDLFSQEELAQWWQRLCKLSNSNNPEVSIEPKIDGVALSLRYENGVLTRAVTRGDGETGDDISANARTIRNLPLQLDPKLAPEILEVRGEAYIPFAEFAQLNQTREEAGQELFANPRNTTSGALKRLNSKEVSSFPLRFIAHGIGSYQGKELTQEADYQTLLQQLQFPQNKPQLYAQSLEELEQAVTKIDQLRHTLPYATDGAVVKLTNFSLRNQLGNTSRAPRWACAYKFAPEQAETTIYDITIQVGRTGVLTPVAELTPVEISGTTVSRATLHNQGEIDRKDIRIGDTALIEKAGEIIPAVVRVVTEKRLPLSQPFHIFTHCNGKCPCCDSPIEQEQGFAAWRCTNFACPAQALTRISHFASRKALDIDSLGKLVATALVSNSLAHSPLQLFSLSLTLLAELNLGDETSPRRLGEKNAEKILSSLQQARTEKPLHRWLYAFGIPHIGERAAKELEKHHQNLIEVAQSPLLADIVALEKQNAQRLNLSRELRQNKAQLSPTEIQTKKNQQQQLEQQITHIKQRLKDKEISPELGPVAAQSVLHFFQNPAGKQILLELEQLGISPQSAYLSQSQTQADLAPKPLQGKTFVLTGTLSISRKQMTEELEQAGAKVSSSISAKTDFLLAGENAGSKKTKATSLGVTIITETQAQQMLHPPHNTP